MRKNQVRDAIAKNPEATIRLVMLARHINSLTCGRFTEKRIDRMYSDACDLADWLAVLFPEEYDPDA